MIFLKERGLPSALWLRSNGLSAKRREERLTDGASKSRFVCKPFLFPVFLIPASRLFPLPDAFQACGRQWQGFRVEYAQTRLRKILPETALPPDLAAAIKPYATFASVHRERVADGMNLNYTIGYYL